jgi:hypothetical protein
MCRYYPLIMNSTRGTTGFVANAIYCYCASAFGQLDIVLGSSNGWLPLKQHGSAGK